MVDESIDAKVSDKPSLFSRKALIEYAKVAGATEVGAYLGANIGIFTTATVTNSSVGLTGGVLSGDFVGGTIGQLGSFWYNNRKKYRRDDGSFNYLRMTKDFSKVLVYDIPTTAIAYTFSGAVSYITLEHDWDKAAVAGITYLTGMVSWNVMNYFVYHVIKHDQDEELGKALVSRVKEFTSVLTRKKS